MLIATFVLHSIDPSQGRADAVRRTAEEVVQQLGGEPVGHRWLAGGEALDLHVEGLDDRRQAALDALRRAFERRRIDLCLQPAAGREKKLLVADMESTVIENEMLDELAELVGVGDRVAAITARAMNGELDFRAALDERVGLLAGLEVAVLEKCRRRVRLDAGARVLVATAKAHGLATALVSGGFMSFAEPVANDLGFDHVQANRLEIEDGRLTGRVIEPILDRDAKVRALESHCQAHGVDVDAAVTIGDGANDLAMLAAAGFGVAFHGKPVVAEAAPHRIDLGDLSTLLYFLGFPREEWVER